MKSSVCAHGERESTPTAPAVKLIVRTSEKSEHGNPGSAQPMRNLSARAQKLLAPRKAGFCTPIEPAGSGLVRFAKTKADI